MTDEVRVTSSTGGAKGDKIYRFDQIPADPMLELAARYGLGSTKYPAVNGLDNWRNGYAFSLSLAALERHVNAFKRGEDNDASIYREAGLLADGDDPLYDEAGELRPGVSHLGAVVWHCFFLMHHLQHHPELDDRPTTVLARTTAGLAATEDEEDDEDPDEFDGTFWHAFGDATDLRNWRELGLTTDGAAFTSPANLIAKDVNIQATYGGLTIDQVVNGDVTLRRLFPKVKTELSEDGKVTVTALPADEVPLAIGTEVIYLPNAGADPIEGTIEDIRELTRLDTERSRSYHYHVRFSFYERQIVTDARRDQLFIRA